jgi:hypothetical protein
MSRNSSKDSQTIGHTLCAFLGKSGSMYASYRPMWARSRLQVSYLESDLLKIITIYEPDPAEWYDFSRRR